MLINVSIKLQCCIIIDITIIHGHKYAMMTSCMCLALYSEYHVGIAAVYSCVCVHACVWIHRCVYECVNFKIKESILLLEFGSNLFAVPLLENLWIKLFSTPSS